MMRAIIAAIALLLPVHVYAQTETVYADRLSVGSGVPGTAPSVSSVRLQGLATSGGNQVVLIDSTTLALVRRVLGKTDLPAAVAYEDEANTYTLGQTFSSTTQHNGVSTFTVTPVITNAIPALRFIETGGTTNRQRWLTLADGEEYKIVSQTDGDVTTGTPFRAQHTGSLVLDPFSKQVLPNANNEGTIGSPLRKWLSIYAAELNVDVLTYAETLATSGGRWLIAPSTALIEDISDSATTIKVKSNNLANGDIVYLENNSRIEYMTVTSAATRINKAGIGNVSAETGTTNWSTSGTATLTSSVEQHWHGGKSLKWAYTSGAADIIYAPASLLAASTQYTVSVYVKRADGAAVVPVAGTTYRLAVDSANGVICNASVQDVANGWYRIYCTGTSGGSSPAGVAVLGIPTTTNHYFDAWQVEPGATLTAWSRDSASYTVTRNADGTGGDVWEAGSGIVNTRQTGAGLIDCYATQSFRLSTQIGPACAGMVRTSSTYNALSPFWAIGNMRGIYGYSFGSGDVYGAAFGDGNATNLTIDTTNGIRFRDGGTDLLTLSSSTLDLLNTGVIKSGAASAFGTGTGIWLAANSGTPQFRIGNPSGNRLSWDGTNIALTSANMTIDGSSTRIGARNSAVYAAANGYNFSPIAVTGGEFGMFGYDTGTSAARGIQIRNVHSSSGAEAQFAVDLGNGGAGAMSLTMRAATSTGELFLAGFTRIDINATTAASVTLACGGGQAVKNLTTIHGFVTAASCGTP